MACLQKGETLRDKKLNRYIAKALLLVDTQDEDVEQLEPQNRWDKMAANAFQVKST